MATRGQEFMDLVWVDQLQVQALEPRSLPGASNLVGVFYPFMVPPGSIIVNYVTCRVCGVTMLREDGSFQLCYRSFCRMKHADLEPAVVDRRKEWKKMGEAESLVRKRRAAAGLPMYSREDMDYMEGQPLSQIELEILRELANDKLYRQIGDMLGLRKGTVGVYCFKIYRKLGVQGKFSAIEKASKLGLITLNEEQVEKLKVMKSRKVGENIITEREIQILIMLSEGKTWPQIAKVFEVNLQTVKNQGVALYDKLGVSTGLQAVLAAHERGLISFTEKTNG